MNAVNCLIFIIILVYFIPTNTMCVTISRSSSRSHHFASTRFKKCCSFGSFYDGRKCVQNSDQHFSLEKFSNYVKNRDAFDIGIPDCFLYEYTSQQFHVQQNGTILLTFNERIVTEDEYCTDNNRKGNLTAFVCMSYTEWLIDGITGIGLAIAVPFLVATSVAYICLPEHTLHIKAHVCYMISLTTATSILVYFQFNDSNEYYCVIFGYLEYYFSIASFFWLNVICINMWRTFSGDFNDSRYQTHQWKCFLMYNAYAWGIPLVLLVVVVTIDQNTDFDSPYHAGLIDGFCYYLSSLAMILYSQLPIGIILTANIILFSLTALRIKKIDEELFRQDGNRHHHIAHHQQTVNVYVKVVLTMGINWLIDFVLWMIYLMWDSPAHYEEYIWQFIKLHNAAYGISLFFIFICKRRILELLKRRIVKRDKSSRLYFYST